MDPMNSLRKMTAVLRSLAAFFLSGVFLASFSGCGLRAAEAEVEKPALVINQLKLTSLELRGELLDVGISPHELGVEAEGEPQWLSQLVERELLVQEAQRLGLDRESDFMRTIERFWKEALIKLLISRKAKEISSATHVYEPEIESHYERLVKQAQGSPVEPLSVLRDEVRRSVLAEKETQAMEQWLDGLRAQANIAVDEEAIAALR